MAKKIAVTTAQNVSIEYQVADIGERMVAYIIDGLVKLLYIILLSLIAGGFDNLSRQIGAGNYFFGLILVIGILPIIFYSFLMEQFYEGQTLGKRAMAIKVVSFDGSPTTIGQIFLRWLFRLIDFHLITPLIALLVIVIGEKGQRVGDHVAGTAVISLKTVGSESKKPFVKVSNEYTPAYPESVKLNETDIQTLKEVVLSRTNPKFNLIEDSATHLEEVLYISRGDYSAKDFLTKVVKDFNYYNFANKEQLNKTMPHSSEEE